MAQNRPDVLKSFAELRDALYPNQQPAVDPRSDTQDLMRLPPLERLIAARSLRQAGSNLINTKQIHRLTAREILELTAGEREATGIRIISYCPLDERGKIISSEVLAYPIFLLYPTKGGGFQLASTTRVNVADTYNESICYPPLDALDKVDKLMEAGAALRPGQSVDEYNRLNQEVKLSDSLIRLEKIKMRDVAYQPRQRLQVAVNTRSTTPRMELLNEVKDDRVNRYLAIANQLADQLHRANQSLGPLYRFSRSESDDILHGTLEMWLISEGSILPRLIDPTRQAVIRGLRSSSSTNINLKIATQGKKDHERGSSVTIDRTRAEIYERLGLLTLNP